MNTDFFAPNFSNIINYLSENLDKMNLKIEFIFRQSILMVAEHSDSLSLSQKNRRAKQTSKTKNNYDQ